MTVIGSHVVANLGANMITLSHQWCGGLAFQIQLKSIHSKKDPLGNLPSFVLSSSILSFYLLSIVSTLQMSISSQLLIILALCSFSLNLSLMLHNGSGTTPYPFLGTVPWGCCTTCPLQLSYRAHLHHTGPIPDWGQGPIKPSLSLSCEQEKIISHYHLCPGPVDHLEVKWV